MITPCTHGYLPGLNANLNAMDIYENDVDVFIIDGGDLPEEWKERAVKTFNFKITIIPIKNLMKDLYIHPKEKNVGIIHYLITTPYVLMQQLAKDYKLVSFIGADMCITDNIMKWYEVAEKTDMIITANNPFALNRCQDIDDRNLDKNGLVGSMPVADVPCIMNPNVHADVIAKTLKLTDKLGDNMRCFGTVLCELKKQNRILELPGNLWTCGIYYSAKAELSNEMGKNGTRPALYWDRERVQAIHRRWWESGVREYPLRDKNPESCEFKNALNNGKIWEQIYRYFNTQGKLKIDYDKYYKKHPKYD